ncbi:uncharacterized protein K02A2.6-like [Chrysoperla carnea]|uniref:uncharacterized protein K02A2.6-like n=1 Tax=Chrysoperla carnea TaxID=189513 RepID=UPI001D073E01|nr:uncharacterized protein K02A2.6-like [Chrysoperla carnea]
MRGNRVIIPKTLQEYVLGELHNTHCGIVKMKAIARSTVYWKNIDKDIEQIAKACHICAQYQKADRHVPLHKWETPTEPWQRIHIDFAGPIYEKQLLIVIDALTKWVEVIVFDKAPTSKTTITALKHIFAAQGLPMTIVSDNATIFKSDEFEQFLEANGIAQLNSAPNHPATNGQAERTVQTIKTKLKKLMSESTGNIREKIDDILFDYRATPLNCGKTPAELHYSRQIKTKLHLLTPPTNLITDTKYDKHERKIKSFTIGQRVLSRNYYGNDKWRLGTIVERLGKIHYHVRLDNKVIVKRHANQLKRTACQTTPATSVDEQVKKNENKAVLFKLPDISVQNQRKPAQEEQKSEQVQVRRSTRTRRPVERLNL